MQLRQLFGISAFLLGTFITTPGTAGLIAHWDFDELGGTTAHDQIGSVDGTLIGGVGFTGTGGVIGGAVEFSDGFVSMGTNFPALPAFSIQAWVQTDDPSGMMPVSRHRAGVAQGYFLSLNDVNDGFTVDGSAGFYSANGTSGGSAVGGTAVNNGTWRQLVGVYSNGTTQIFVDGALVGTGNFGHSTPASVDFLVGGVVNSVGTAINFYRGLIDEVKVFDHALSAQEVEDLYDATLNPSPVPEPASIVLFAIGGLGVLTRTRIRKV